MVMANPPFSTGTTSSFRIHFPASYVSLRRSTGVLPPQRCPVRRQEIVLDEDDEDLQIHVT